MPFLSNKKANTPMKIGGFWVGCQAWTFNQRTVYEAVELTARAGGSVIEFFPGQKLSTGSEDRLDPNLAKPTLDALKAHCAKLGVVPIAYGVTGIGLSDASNRKLFEFAKYLGLKSITCEPDANAFDKIEALVKEFDIKIAIHNHPKQPTNPNYRYWDPNYALSILKNRDPRIGVCADLGHFVRSGIKPIDAVKQLKGRIHSSHVKDLNVFSPNGEDRPYGMGVGNISKVLEELRKQNYDGHLSVEYERGGDGPLDEVSACIGFIRGWAAGKNL
jgi:sugar phosphate isomerase/epimerase